MSILGYEQAAGSKQWKVIPVLTLDQVEAKTNPKVNGENDGNSNSPGADATELSKTERNILFEAETFLNKTKDFINKNLTDLARKIESFSVDNITDVFSDLSLEPKKEFNKYKIQAEPELQQLRKLERLALRDLNLFKARNDLQRNATYPESTFKHLSVLYAFLLGESIANMYFFAAGSDLGFLGGFFQAALVSLTNVSLSYLVGFFAMTQLNHIQKYRRYIGGFFMLLYVSFLGVFHLLVAHYRDLLSIDPENAIVRTWDRFREAPFSLDTFESLMVLLIGVVIAVFAVSKGYKHDDVYPGYGAVDRLHKKREDAYNKREAGVRGKLVGLISDAERKVHDRIAEYESRVKDMKDQLNGAKSVITHIDTVDKQVAEVVNTAVMIYREANKSVRTESVPDYFMTTPKINNRLEKGIDIVSFNGLSDMVKRSEAALNTIRGNAQKAVQSLFRESEEIGGNIDNLANEVDKKASKTLEKYDTE